ncbi:hypothetical protein IJT93_04600 [bacterium]|nr:hypothetical protein [bacterium]
MYYRMNNGEEKTFAQKLGWLNNPGPAFSFEDNQVIELVWPNGMRESRPEIDKKSRLKVAFVGCSYTFGEGVNGPETMVWRLNDRYPDVTFDNWGVNGFRPLQILELTRRLADSHEYDLIVYNVINAAIVRIKYMSIQGNNNLSVNSCYILAPFLRDHILFYSEHYANENIFLIENRSLIFDILKRYCIQRSIEPKNADANSWTPKLGYIIDEMVKTCKKNRIDFAVCGLDNHVEYSVFPFIDPNIETIPAGFERQNEPRYRVRQIPHYHPNAEVHAHWAENFSRWFDSSKYMQPGYRGRKENK